MAMWKCVHFKVSLLQKVTYRHRRFLIQLKNCFDLLKNGTFLAAISTELFMF